jgi:large subunit ribosomal protein L25
MKIEVTAFPRNSNGTGPARRMRKTGRVPGVVYGAGKESQAIELDHNALSRHLKMEAFHASILDMTVDGSREKVLLRDVQWHPWRAEVLHVDFQRIAADRKIHMKVPLHFVNAETCPGVKEGGIISHVMNDIDIQCLPDDLPEYVEVDLGALDIGQSIHVNELVMAKGVELVPRLRQDNSVVATLTLPRAAIEEQATAEGAAADKPEAAAGAAAGDKDKK